MKPLFFASFLILTLAACSPASTDSTTAVGSSSDSSAVSSVVALHSYQTKESCESATGKTCHFVTCDYIPEGKTFEEVCGKDFQEGWQPIN
jgi:hypothetical protein